MKLERREFLKLLGMTAGAAGLGACSPPWSVPDRLVARALRGPGLETERQTICGLCEGGCGLTVRLLDGLPVGLKANPNHPLNRGGLCPVGQAGLDVLYSPDRLTSPLRRGPSGNLQSTSWEEALSEIAGRLSELKGAGNGSRIAVLSGEHGQLFHELAARFTRWLGSSNIAHTETVSAQAYTLTQGIDRIPGFDLEQADRVLVFGLDLYEDGPAPVHAIAAMVGSRPTEERGTILHVGTRRSPSSTKAEQTVSLLPGTYAAFALGVAHVLVREGRYDRSFVEEHTFGFEDWNEGLGRPRLGFRRLLLERYYPDRVAQLCGCNPQQIVSIARRFSEAEAPLALAGGDATTGSNATWTVMAVQALNALMGSFDRPGGVVLPPSIPFTPLTDLDDTAPEESIFAGYRDTALAQADPVEAMADGVLEGSHSMDVLFVIGADPMFDSPARRRLAEAMGRIPMVVSLTPFVDDTAAAADVLLPTHVFLEAWQESTTPATVAFASLGLASPVIEPLHDSRHPADVLLELGRRVSPSAKELLPWSDYVEYLRFRLEGLARSGQGSVVTGSFDDEWESFLEERGWRFEDERGGDGLWNDLVQRSAWWDPVRSRGDWQRLFPTRSGRYEFYSTTLEQKLREIGAKDAPDQDEALRRGIATLGLDAEPEIVCLPHHENAREVGEGEVLLVPFRPITGRGRLGVTSRMVMEMFGYSVLSGWETWAELAPDTAEELDVGDGDRVRLESNAGSIEVVVKVRPGAPGVIHVPLGLGHREGYGAAGGIGSNPLDLVLSERDPLSGTSALSATRVRVKLVERRLHGGSAPVEGGFAE